MIYIESPNNYHRNNVDELSIFLAGGITGCSDWQQVLVNMLKNTDLILVNPRRENFPIHDPDAAKEQITWEHCHLKEADAISFWFSPETLNPIVLYELGSWSNAHKQLFVGVHSDYKRRQDVEIQTYLVRPEIEIVYSLEDLANQIIEWANK